MIRNAVETILWVTLLSFTVAIVFRCNAYLTIWTDFMLSYITLDAAIIPFSITIAEDRSTVHTHADMRLQKSRVAAVAVNTSIGVEDRGPPTAPFDSA
eukprot:scaffold13264_cov106-Skeletonema_dohrnii-CCMP3373.AAC.4